MIHLDDLQCGGQLANQFIHQSEHRLHIPTVIVAQTFSGSINHIRRVEGLGRLVEHQEPRHGPIVLRKPLVKSEVCDEMVPFVLWIELVFEVDAVAPRSLQGRSEEPLQPVQVVPSAARCGP